MKRVVLLVLFIGKIFYASTSFAQQTTIKGKVTDGSNGEGIPLANVYFKSSKAAVTTDFDGNYILTTNTLPSDSLTASYIGYKSTTKQIVPGQIQTLNFTLSPESVELAEVVITNKEDPAYNIIRKAVARKEFNDRRKLSAYQYEMYKKVEIDLENISDKLKNKWYMKQITRVLDSVARMNGEDGKLLIPMYISETIEDYFYRLDPKLSKEVVRAQKVTGVGVSDNSIIAQMINASFYDYNFYENRVTIMNKDFVSPIADGWANYYKFYLEDSVYLGDNKCYKIDVTPKRKQDLAFEGKIWVADSVWALKQVSLKIGPEANLNFIDGIKIQQELMPTSNGPWLPSKSRLLIDVGQVGDSSAGMLLKFYISNKNVIENQAKPESFYREKLIILDTSQSQTNDFWIQNRHDSLSASEKHVFAMVDSIKRVPIVKTYIEIIDLAVNGYYDVGKVDIGPLLYTYAYNNIEDHRFQLGMRTNSKLNKNWLLVGRVAYGTKDEEWKYQGQAEHIFRRKSWSLAGIEHLHDIDQVALKTDNKYENNLFTAFTKWGNIARRRPYMNTFTQLYIQSDLFKGFTQKVAFTHTTFEPLYDFAYYNNPSDIPGSGISRRFETSEIVFESKYAKNITLVKNGNHRNVVGSTRFPVFTFRYTLGIKDLLGSDLHFNKFYFNVSHLKNVGLLGKLKYAFSIGYTPDPVPYPLLENHLGNQTYFLNYSSFNMMNFFEFTSDTYTSLHIEQHFEGLLFNRIPFLKKLKWREVAACQVLVGTVSDKNYDLIPDNYPKFSRLNLDEPYAEVSYGIENIFKLVRIDFMHRLTYLNSNSISGRIIQPFAVKIGLQFNL
ncbi:MAG: carboxypeptidase-like regulatory domain-containing protein [Opitutaceae bacterium]|nr:carboxypeptidase-like regulatory domain-containing protein [Cytophagales bacterium]